MAVLVAALFLPAGEEPNIAKCFRSFQSSDFFVIQSDASDAPRQKKNSQAFNDKL